MVHVICFKCAMRLNHLQRVSKEFVVAESDNPKLLVEATTIIFTTKAKAKGEYLI